MFTFILKEKTSMLNPTGATRFSFKIERAGNIFANNTANAEPSNPPITTNAIKKPICALSNVIEQNKNRMPQRSKTHICQAEMEFPMMVMKITAHTRYILLILVLRKIYRY